MSTRIDVSQTGKNYTGSSSSVANNNSVDLRLSEALKTGNTGDSENQIDASIEKERQEQIEKNKNYIENLCKDYKVKKEDVFSFVNKVFNYSENDLYGLNKDEFGKVWQLLNAVLEFQIKITDLKNKSGKKADKNVNPFDVAAEKVSKMLNDGNTIEQVTNFINNFGNNGLLDILRIHCPKILGKYNPAENIPKNDLIEAIKEFITDFKEHAGKKGDKKDIGKSIQIFLNLLGNTAPNDRAALFEAFKEVAESDEDIKKAFHSLMDSFQTKEELEAFINSGAVSEILDGLNIPKEGFSSCLLKLFDASEGKGVEKQVVIKELEEYIRPKIDEYQRIINTSEDKITEEDKKFLETWESLGTKLAEVLKVLTVKDLGNINKYTSYAKQIKIEQGAFYQSVISFAKDNNIKLDTTTILDKETRDAFSEAIKKYEAQVRSEESNSESENSGIGFAQRYDYDEYLNYLNNKNALEATTYNNSKPETKFEVIKDTPSVTNPIGNVKDLTRMNADQLRAVLGGNSKIKFSDVVKQYKNLTKEGQDFVVGALEAKNDALKQFYLGMIKSNHIVTALIIDFDLDPDSLNIGLDYANRKRAERAQEEKCIVD